MRDLWWVDGDGTLRVRPHRGQARAWRSEARVVAMLAGTQSGKCMDPNSLILLATGERRKIKDVRAGDVVLTLGSDLRLRQARVTASFPTGTQRVIRVTTATGRGVVVTREHPLYGVNGWTPAGEMAKGAFVAIPRGYPDLGVETRPASEMRLMGYLLGDGGLSGTTSPTFTNIDGEILRDLAECLPEPCHLVFSDRITYRVSTGMRGGAPNPVTDLCREWGLWGCNSHEKRIPDFVFLLRRESIAPMLNALLACDGWVDNKGVGYASASERLARDVQHLYLRFGALSRLRRKWTRCNGKRFVSWEVSVCDLESLEILSREIGIIAKQDKLDALIADKRLLRPNTKDVVADFDIQACYRALGTPRHSSKGGYEDQTGYRLVRSCRRERVSRPFAQVLAEHFDVEREKAFSDIYWDKIRRIDDFGEREVWDITVEGSHNFVAEDVYAHNTSWAPIWLNREITRKGPGDYLAVTATYPLLKLKLLPEFVRFFCHTLRWGVLKKADNAIVSHDGNSRIIFGSATNAESLESATAKAAVLDEAGQDQFRLASWEAIRRRLSLAEGRVLIGTTVYNLGWVKQQVYDRWLAGDAGYDVVQFDSTYNPLFPKAEYERARRELPRWKFRMFYQGLFDRPAGLIYGDFDDVTQIIDWAGFERLTGLKAIPADWPRIVGWDFGGVNTATLWGAVSPDGDVFLYDEALEGNLTTEEHAKRALAKIEADALGVTPLHFGGAAGENQWRLDLGNHGVPVMLPPVTAVEQGIDRVVSLVKRRKLYVLSNLSYLREGLATYSREVDEAGNPTEKIKNKNDFHMIDALRYLACGLENMGVGIRWL